MKTLNVNEQQQQQMKTHRGFIAALDQSGGSTPSWIDRFKVSLRRPTPE